MKIIQRFKDFYQSNFNHEHRRKFNNQEAIPCSFEGEPLFKPLDINDEIRPDRVDPDTDRTYRPSSLARRSKDAVAEE